MASLGRDARRSSARAAALVLSLAIALGVAACTASPTAPDSASDQSSRSPSAMRDGSASPDSGDASVANDTTQSFRCGHTQGWIC